MYFNPRSREGSDLIDINPQRTRHYFNPRSREGSDVYTYLPIMVLRIFQSTLPRGERLSIFESSNTSRIISIHAPARGATYFPTCHFFDNSISIHAPARGATNIRFTSASLNSISIHAPARGATRRTNRKMAQQTNFNPRSREGSDRLYCFSRSNSKQISIHAPARGATA